MARIRTGKTTDKTPSPVEKAEVVVEVPEGLEPVETKALELPGGAMTDLLFSTPDTASQVDTVSSEEFGPKVPYLMFYDHRSKKADDIKAAVPGVMAGDMFLVYSDGDVEPLPRNAWSFTILNGLQYWANVDFGAREIRAVTLDKAVAENDKNLKKQYLALMIIDTGEEFVAAVSTLRTTKVSGVVNHAREIANTQTPEWLDHPRQATRELRSRVVGVVKAPALRVWSAGYTTGGTSEAGFAYQVFHTRPRLATEEQMVRLQEWLTGAGQADLEACLEAYQAKEKEVLAAPRK